MNILFIATRSPYPLISGYSLRTYHILKGAAENHNVTLLTFIQLPEHELKDENLNHLRSFCKAVHPFEIPADVSKFKLFKDLSFNMFSTLPFVAEKYDAPEMRRKIREIVRTEKIDLVHVDLLPLTVYTNEFENLPKVMVNHNVESLRLYRWFKTEPNYVKKAFLGLQWLKLRSYELSSMGRFDACVVVSEKDKELLEAMGVQNKLFVVPNGTDTEFFQPNENQVVDHSVVWLGHMDVHTNRDAVLYFWKEIYPILRKKYPQVRMTFVGTAPPREIEDVAKTDSQVEVTGFVDDIRPVVSRAAVMVVPIRIGSGTRLKILDAMAMGKAIVSTSIGCEGIEAKDGEEILIADAPEDFAQSVMTLLTDNDKRKTLERNALKVAQNYSWKFITKLQENVYREALQRRKL